MNLSAQSLYFPYVASIFDQDVALCVVRQEISEFEALDPFRLREDLDVLACQASPLHFTKRNAPSLVEDAILVSQQPVAVFASCLGYHLAPRLVDFQQLNVTLDQAFQAKMIGMNEIGEMLSMGFLVDDDGHDRVSNVSDQFQQLFIECSRDVGFLEDLETSSPPDNILPMQWRSQVGGAERNRSQLLQSRDDLELIRQFVDNHPTEPQVAIWAISAFRILMVARLIDKHAVTHERRPFEKCSGW